MSAERCAYLDTSALAKWYLNEPNLETVLGFLRGLDAAVISGLSVTEMRSLFSGRRRMGDLTVDLKSVLFAAFLEDRDPGRLQRYPVNEARFDEATQMIISAYDQGAQLPLAANHMANRYFLKWNKHGSIKHLWHDHPSMLLNVSRMKHYCIIVKIIW